MTRTKKPGVFGTPGFSRMWIVLPPLLFLAVFYFYPLFRIFLLSFMPEGMWDAGGLEKLFRTGHYLRVLWFTTWQAALSTVLTLIAALPGAYVFARYNFPGKRLLQAFTTVPFVLPTVVVAAAFEALTGPHGLLNSWLMAWLDLPSPPIAPDRTVWAILLAHVFYNYTVVLRMVGGFWAGMGDDLTGAARMLGASPWTAFRKITLPLLRPVLFTAGLLIFIFCFSSFGVILILGGPRFATLEVEIYRQAVSYFNLPLAAALSLLQILFTFGMMWAYTALQRRSAVALTPESRERTGRRASAPGERLMVGGNILFMVMLLGLPLMALVIRSFSTKTGPGLIYYRALFEDTTQSLFFVPPADAVFHSLGFAGTTLIMALILGTLAATFLAGRKDRLTALLDPIFMLPLSTSAVTLGFGFIIALDRPPLNLRTSVLLVPIAHTLVAFPFVVRSLLPALRSIPRSLREAASVLGASPWQVWRSVDLPIVGRALLVGAVFAFTVSLGEFGATVFVARPQTPTMPLAIYRFLGQPGAMNYGQAMAMSSLLMLVTATGFLLLEKARIGQAGEF
ncbi:iron ABC transporter permease [Desulfonema ishimotonii]|uniref:Iron ABC transporter permease n=1 Tax=Desulfonema ishimotonii TaxID=45657 RepID=A0A401G157_9BACT|nr:iron ABC transporter permease [Desulfonema ishimotonii]GBC62941.1 iron ABC transporter permease [Desulfonema ishimotonii]